jgi:transposase
MHFTEKSRKLANIRLVFKIELTSKRLVSVAEMSIKIERNFSDADWEATPKAVQDHILTLEKLILDLLSKAEQLEQRVEQLESQKNKNSRNSSKPPSSDNPYQSPQVSDKSRKPKGKAGGKKGHQGHRQKLLEPTCVIAVLPQACSCGCLEIENRQPFYTHQEIELPEIEMDITHFILHQGECVGCGKKLKASIPDEHRSGYGPRLSAFIGEISGICGDSRRTLKDICQSVFNFHISLGAISKVINRVSEAIFPHYQAIGEVARGSDVNYVDETSWYKKGALMWLWTMVNQQVAFFLLHNRRSKEAFLELIGDWKGILVSDAYGVYQKWVNLRQTCLAHLIRKARGLSERSHAEIQCFGQKALKELQLLCHWAKAPPTEEEWNAFYMRFIELIFDHLQREDDAGKLARQILREWDSLWVFLEVADVEPTNNRGERSLRFGVLWRKRSQGTRSDKGDRWVERILSLRQTARIHGISSFGLLTQAMEAYFKKQKPDLSWIYAK